MSKNKTNAQRRRDASRLGGSVQNRIAKRFRDVQEEIVDAVANVMADDIEEVEADAERRVTTTLDECNRRIRETNEGHAKDQAAWRERMNEERALLNEAKTNLESERAARRNTHEQLRTEQAEVARLRALLKVVRSQVTSEE